MNTKSVPSEYRYCIPLRSTIARPTFTPALNVRSITAPVLTLRSFVRTKAPPLPGFTCWNSTTWNSTLSSSRVMPFFRSLVDTLNGGCSSQLDQIAVGDADDDAPIGIDLHHVLDPNAADPGEVDPRLDGDDGARGQRIVLFAPQAGSFMDLEADAVTQAVDERLAVPGFLDHSTADGVDRRARDAGT